MKKIVKGTIEKIQKLEQKVCINRLNYEQRISSIEITVRDENGFKLMGNLPETFQGEIKVGDQVQFSAGVIIPDDLWGVEKIDYGFFKRPLNFQIIQ